MAGYAYPPAAPTLSGDVETICGNMPPHGLAAAVGGVLIFRGRDSAAARIGDQDDDLPALPPY